MLMTFDAFEEKALLKTLWEKEKMLLTSFFSFSHNVFYPVKDNSLFLAKISNLERDKILDWSRLKQIADNILKCI